MIVDIERILIERRYCASKKDLDNSREGREIKIVLDVHNLTLGDYGQHV